MEQSHGAINEGQEEPEWSDGRLQPGWGKQLARILDEIKIMLAFASESGKAIPPSVAHGLATIWGFPEKEVGSHGKPVFAIAGNDRSRLIEASAVHAELSKLVAPATPVSIETTRPKSKSFVGRLLVNNPAIQLLVGLTVASLVVFLIANSLMLANQDLNGAMEPVLLLLAAALGAGFHALMTAHRFIVNRTFDPQYNQSYLIRYVLGLTAGMILGYFGRELLFNGSSEQEELQQLGATALALVGGFAADAVAEILTRIADILVAMVKGGQREQLDAKEAEIRAEEESKQRAKGQDAAKQVLVLATRAGDDDQRRALEKVASLLIS